jgi:uncharacterized UPF0146 family protein
MASSNLIVNVTISKSTRVVQLAAFNIPCIFGPSARITEPEAFTSYNQALQANGGPFLPSDPEAIELQAVFSQQGPTPPSVIVAPNSAAVAQVDTLAVNTLTSGHQYKFTLNSVSISYTATGGDTQQSILAALLAAIGTAFPSGVPVTGAVTGTGSGALLTLTAVTAGLGVSYTSVDSQLTYANTTANHSITDDIATAQAAVSSADQFYGVIVCSHVASDILQVAKYIETQLLVYVTASADADCLTTATTDIMSQLKSLEFDRTMILYSAEANTNGPDGAWMGYMIATTPGIGNWAMKTLEGVDPDNLNPTQIANVISKNGNIYVTEGGNGCTLYGITPGGEYFDVTIFLDWVASTMKSGIIAVETDPLNLKIPYTNQGITQLENPVRQTLQQGQDNQGFVPGWTVSAPNANAVSPADRANRVLNGLAWSAQLAGAINQINVQGYVTQ